MKFVQRIILTTVVNGLFATPGLANGDTALPFADAVANLYALGGNAPDNTAASLRGARPQSRNWQGKPMELEFGNTGAPLFSLDATGLRITVTF